jgi:hypothetical protein
MDPPDSRNKVFLRTTSQPPAGISERARWHQLYAGGQTLALVISLKGYFGQGWRFRN